MWMVLNALIVVAVSALAVAGFMALNRTRFRPQGDANDVAGLIFGAVGILYGALLAFVVFATWESYAGAEEAVTMEGATLVAVYRDSQQFPEPERTEIQAALRLYTNKVLATEWGSHGNLRPHTAPDILNPVWALYRGTEASTPGAEADLASAMERLHELELQRHLRHLSGEATLPDVFWPVLLAGSIIMVLFSYALRHHNLKLHAAMTALLTAVLTLTLLLIFSLNKPFTGPIPVSQQPLLHALVQFNAIDLPTIDAVDPPAPAP